MTAAAASQPVGYKASTARAADTGENAGMGCAALRLLVVDDDEVDRLLIRRVLRDAPRAVQIREVDTVAGGFNAIAQEEFDCLIVDLSLPDGSGLALLQDSRVGARWMPPTIILTAKDDEATAIAALHQGAQDYLVKGQIDHRALVRSIRYAVGRKRAEKEAHESTERFRAVFDAAAVGIAVTEMDGRFIRTNGAMHALLGREEEELQGMSLNDILHPEDRFSEVSPFDHLWSGGQGHHKSERRFLTASGSIRCGQFVLSIATQAGGVPRWPILMLEDSTARSQGDADREKLLRQLQEALEARDTFLGVASHELKTPVTSFWLQVQGMIRKAHKNNEPVLSKTTVVEQLERINRQIVRLNHLIEQLLDVSRIGAGHLYLEPQEMELTALTGTVVERLRPLADVVGSSVDIVAPTLIFGRWDLVRIDQVITNLVSNAIKYGAGNPVKVVVVEDGDAVILSVGDNGIGMAAEDQERIFDRFERLRASKDLGGLGLGLWIARETVRSMGGEITVDSRLGVGSTFMVKMPRALEALPSKSK